MYIKLYSKKTKVVKCTLNYTRKTKSHLEYIKLYRKMCSFTRNMRLRKVKFAKIFTKVEGTSCAHEVRLHKVRLRKVRLYKVRLHKVRLRKVRICKVILCKVKLHKMRLRKVRLHKLDSPKYSPKLKVPCETWQDLGLGQLDRDFMFFERVGRWEEGSTGSEMRRLCSM